MQTLDQGLASEYGLHGDLPIDGNMDLLKAVCNHFRSRHRIDGGFRLCTYVDAPAGSGLGSSSTLAVAIAGAFVEWLRLPLGSYDIASLAYRIERGELGMAGGKQDQYAATFGGFNYMEFFKDDKVIVNPLRVDKACTNELENNLLLFYTSQSRISARIIEEQQRNVTNNDRDSVGAMHVIKEQATEMKEALLTGRIDRIGELLHEGFVYKKKMASSISNPLIDRIYETALEAGALGGKVLGAGGGGFMVFYCPDFKRYQVMQSLAPFNGIFQNLSIRKRRFIYMEYMSMEQREGIVLAGGLGTRLRSVVSDLPKCMAPVAGRPFLYYLLKYMEVRRFTRVVLALGYMHESVQRWLAGEKWDFEIRCSLEETPLGTGGAVRQALSRTDGDEVYILNGDTFFDVDTDEMARVHRASGAAATIALKPMTDFSRYGVVETAPQGRIVAFREKKYCPRGQINGGVYLVDKKSGLLDFPSERFSFETDILQQRVRDCLLTGYASDGYFIDIGIPEDYEKADTDFKTLFPR